MSFDEILDCTAGVGVLAAKLKVFHERPNHMRLECEFVQFLGGEAADVLEAERDTQETAGEKEPQKSAGRRGNSEEFLG